MEGNTRRTEANRYKVSDLLVLVSSGRIRIPRFQRGLRWDNNDILRLFDSVYQGFPVGTLLFWQRPAEHDRVRIGKVEIDAPEHPEALWVVDGQQRIHALASTLLPLADSSSPTDSLVFDLTNERFFYSSRDHASSRRLPLRFARDPRQVLSWLAERQLDEKMQSRALQLADQLWNFEIPAYVVEGGDEEDLSQIFDRINTFGKRMTRAEVFHALSTKQTDEGPNLETLEADVSAVGFGKIPHNTLLYSVLAVRGPDVTREFRSEFGDDPGERLEAMEQTRVALRRSVDFLQAEVHVPHARLIPYQHLLVGLVRFFALHADPAPWDRVLLRRWFWRSAVHGPLAKHGSAGTLRLTTRAITSGTAYESVERLLGTVPELDLGEIALVGQFGLNRSDTRITLCAMAALRPLELTRAEATDNNPIDVAAALDQLGSEAMPRLVTTCSAEDSAEPTAGAFDSPEAAAPILTNTTANRTFVSAAEHRSGVGSDVLTDIVLGLRESANADNLDVVLRSHAFPEAAVESLRDGDETLFLKLRHDLLSGVVHDFLATRAEWDYPTRPAISFLLSNGADG